MKLIKKRLQNDKDKANAYFFFYYNKKVANK